MVPPICHATPLISGIVKRGVKVLSVWHLERAGLAKDLPEDHQ
jgi:hypothetical protein